jgi:predicted metal-dependent hydrolase
LVDEITPGELARRLDSLDQKLDNIPTRNEIEANFGRFGSEIQANRELAVSAQNLATAVDGRSAQRHEKVEGDIAKEQQARIVADEAEAERRREGDNRLRDRIDLVEKTQNERERQDNNRKWGYVASIALAGVATVFSLFGRQLGL